VKKGLVIAFSGVLIVGTMNAVATTPPKAGATCTKLGLIQIDKNVKYTCIKSGMKLIWNKGVRIIKPITSPTPKSSRTPEPVSTQLPSPTPTLTSEPATATKQPTSPDDLNGKNCETENQIVKNSVGEFWCLKGSSGALHWSQNHPPSQSPTPSASPTKLLDYPSIADGPCAKVGARVNNAIGYLECRMVKGKNLVWIQLSSTLPKYSNPKSAQDVSLCKLQGYHRGNALTGFGIDVTLEGSDESHLNKRINPALGVNDILIVPLDFRDLPGDKNLADTLLSNRASFLNWINYFSNGKLKVNLDYIDHWVHMPDVASRYNLPDFVGENENSYTQSGNRKIAQLYINEIDKIVDLSRYRTVLIMYPSKHDDLKLDLVPRSVEFQTKSGIRTMSLFADPAGYDSDIATPLWVFWLHELGHDWGLYGHVPNGWFVGIMENQGGFSTSLNAWERYVLNWMPDNQVYCDVKSQLQNATVKLSPVERADQQTKMIAVALDDHRLLVVEAHGRGEWTDFRPEQSKYLYYDFQNDPYYNIMVYIVDTKFNHLNQPILTNPDGSAFSTDDGVTRLLPRYAYLQQVDGGVGSNDYRISQSMLPQVDYTSYFGVQGDSYTIEGVRITLEKTGDFETVNISKV
jgi:hypothetical protein